MSVNPINNPAIEGEEEKGALGASNGAAKAAGVYVQHPRIASHWAAIKRGDVQGTLKDVAMNLERLLTKCQVEGPHKVFRWTLHNPKNTANEAALMLIIGLTVQLDEQYNQAKQDHLSILRAELEAYEAQADQTPSTI